MELLRVSRVLRRRTAVGCNNQGLDEMHQRCLFMCVAYCVTVGVINGRGAERGVEAGNQNKMQWKKQVVKTEINAVSSP